ncbi:GGDEF domain-containing protein [Fictibacillus phosphorivorans]|uniref:GGDEF domain-containing protein n=1 Tax=Fictibacillus phosphorivorans TaxID=1221500 RepID=UPI002040E372|nr:GGDEF domain-containing protein [Fictibacillus phosphorivorans]MCM3718660.1 GGDEF domain-containing protein [Fictibacillus phosphorivorans]MCM3776283.1 GGDEF domain-containing protein [Fictibacillus phosphorivorans]
MENFQLELRTLKKSLFKSFMKSIPNMIHTHKDYLSQFDSFHSFMNDFVEQYEKILEKFLRGIVHAVFLPEERFQHFLNQAEQKAFRSGIHFLRHQRIPHQALACFSSSIRESVLQEMKSVIASDSLQVQLFMLDRWNTVAHRAITGFLSGFSSQQFKDLKEISIRDPLTNLYNRRYFYDCLENEMNKAQKQELPITLVMFDINNFKHINDEYGHHAGDELLQQIAELSKRLKLLSGFRFGGDEFVFLLPGLKEDAAYELVEKMENQLMAWNKSISLAYGAIELLGDACENIDYYLQLADERMYSNKREIKA